jgi:cytochrome bd-type quinol oxidase subunit 1
MESALLYDRLRFAFAVTYHYVFPQLTLGPRVHWLASVMLFLGSFYCLSRTHLDFARTSLRTGVVVAARAVVFQILPSGAFWGRVPEESK